jgi:O-antigen/teichoic acid export membrane protein
VIRREILSAYLASGSRLLSWIVVSAVVYRRLGPDYFAVLVLIRTTIGLFNYTTLELAPAMVRMLALEKAEPNSVSEVYSSAAALAGITAIAGTILAAKFADFFPVLFRLPRTLADYGDYFWATVFSMGLGMVFRIISDSAGAALQVRGKIPLDNFLLAGAEWLWLILAVATHSPAPSGLELIADWWLVSAIALMLARVAAAQIVMGRRALAFSVVRFKTIKMLLAFGLLVALAQSADFLYAPTDNILINRFINPITVAVYAPAIQIDAGLLLLVGGIAAVILPKSAIAHAGGDQLRVQRYYVFGTLGSLAILVPAAVCVWIVSPWLFQAWLHDPMPATVAILPMILIHTIVGGSSAVGRSVLLAVGKVRPFTLAVLIAGVSNVLLSFVFVRFCGLGLRGIVLGTILTVVGRCGVWMPWYVMRVLRAEA